MIATTSALSLDVDNLTLRAGRRIVAVGISFVADTSRITWVTGENGAGKSTLVRVLAGRTPCRGNVRWTPTPRWNNVAYYAPAMAAPHHVTVSDWFALQNNWCGDANIDDASDALLPNVSLNTCLSKLSTGEAKRLLLWSLLRTERAYTLLDEPYEHLSPPAKDALTRILVRRSANSVVVVATNQEIPLDINPHIIKVG